jgi:hypothetical protein
LKLTVVPGNCVAAAQLIVCCSRVLGPISYANGATVVVVPFLLKSVSSTVYVPSASSAPVLRLTQPL